jgi:hypothetical protein
MRISIDAIATHRQFSVNHPRSFCVCTLASRQAVQREGEPRRPAGAGDGHREQRREALRAARRAQPQAEEALALEPAHHGRFCQLRSGACSSVGR